MIDILIALLHETLTLTKRGFRIMLLHGTLCSVLLGALLMVQQELPIVPVWALLLLYILFLLPHTLMLVALMRGMLFERMREHFLFTLKWKTYHTNFLYDSLYFLGVGTLILFSAEGIILVTDTYIEINTWIEERMQAEGEVEQQMHMRESFSLLLRSGILVVMGLTGALFFALMLIWARNVILMPAAALGYRIYSDEARLIMDGHVFLVAVTTMLVNFVIAGSATELYKVLAESMPIKFATTFTVVLTYWLAIYLNAAFCSATFSLFTEDYQLRSDFKGF